jgi:hypothetical protein
MLPTTTRCLGSPTPKHLQWQTSGRRVPNGNSPRLEHIHTLPQPWKSEDEFKRAKTWLLVGIDDVLEVLAPGSQGPAVVTKDSIIPPGEPGGS